MTQFRAPEKEKLVNAFLRGESVTDLSAFFAVKRTTVEDVLRESITGLAALNKVLYKQLHPRESFIGPPCDQANHPSTGKTGAPE